jgi:hypothetical protein
MPSWKKVIISGSNAILNTVSASSFTGSFTGSFLGTASYANSSLSSSYSLTAVSASYTLSASYALRATSASYASSSTSASYAFVSTSASYASSSTSASYALTASYIEPTGLPNSYLYVTRNTNQTILIGTWANEDIIFPVTTAASGISYASGTGLASLIADKVYRITARLAWNAANIYLFEYSCYDSSNVQIGPSVEIVQPTNTSNNISDSTLDFIYAPTVDTDVKIRMTPNTTATPAEIIIGNLNTQMIIQQIA